MSSIASSVFFPPHLFNKDSVELPLAVPQSLERLHMFPSGTTLVDYVSMLITMGEKGEGPCTEASTRLDRGGRGLISMSNGDRRRDWLAQRAKERG